MNKYAIRPNQVAAMVKKAFRFHGKRLEQLPVNDRIILRKTDRTGLVVVKNAQGDYVLVTIDPTLYNTEHPSPELAVWKFHRMWPSLARRLLREQGAGGSNPLTPTMKYKFIDH